MDKDCIDGFYLYVSVYIYWFDCIVTILEENKLGKKYDGGRIEGFPLIKKKGSSAKNTPLDAEVGLVNLFMANNCTPILHAFLQEPLFLPEVRPKTKEKKLYFSEYDYSLRYETKAKNGQVNISGKGYLNTYDFNVFAKILQVLDKNNSHELFIKENDLILLCGGNKKYFYEKRKKLLRDSIQRLSSINTTLNQNETFNLLPKNAYCAQTKTYKFKFQKGLFQIYEQTNSWQTIDLEFYDSLKGSVAKVLYLFIESKFNRNNKNQKSLNKKRSDLAKRLGYSQRNFSTSVVTKELEKGLDALVDAGYLIKAKPTLTDKRDPTYNIYPVKTKRKNNSYAEKLDVMSKDALASMDDIFD